MNERRNLAAIFADPALWRRTALPWFLGLFVLMNLGASAWRSRLEEQRRQNLLLRDADPEHAGKPVRYDWSVGEDLERYLKYVPAARQRPLVIVSGMSQMYAINDPKPADKIIAEHLDDALSPRGVRVFGMGAPNLSNEEALFLLAVALSDPRTRPNVFLYGVCFDTFRNVDLRPNFSALLLSRPEIAAVYRKIAEEHRAKHPLATEKMLASLSAPKVVEVDTAESRLRDQFARVLPIVAARREINAEVLLDLYYLRNAALGIKSSTKRPVLASRYELNKDFLSLMIDVAKDAGIAIPMYVIPLNPLAETPYAPEHYAEFKRWIEALTSERGVPFANLEGVVPGGDWGEIDGQPDFKHFRVEGHWHTAGAILDRFNLAALAASSGKSAER